MRKVTCYAWGRPGDWEAICVDFDLAAQAESLDQVRNELQDAVATYAEHVAELPEKERARFLNRKAPLGLRLRLSLLNRAFALLQLLNLGIVYRGPARTGFALPAP